jgi:RNA polymerase sigma-70 factor (ECF subfamily)
VQKKQTRHPRADNLDNATELELLVRVAGRDRRALSTLYRAYYNPLLRLSYRITGDLELAQDCINDVMLIVWNKAAEFAGRSRVSTWILGIAYRRALSALEKSKRWTARFKAADWHAEIEPFSSSPEPTDVLDLQDLLHGAMKSLTPEHRAVVELTYYYGCSYDEIAAIVDCPVNTVKTRMFHARARLRELLPRLGRDDLQ